MLVICILVLTVVVIGLVAFFVVEVLPHLPSTVRALKQAKREWDRNWQESDEIGKEQ